MAPDYSKQKRTLNGIETLSFTINYMPLDQFDYNRVLRMNKGEAFEYASSVVKSKKLNKDIQERLKKKQWKPPKRTRKIFGTLLIAIKKWL